MNDTLGLIVNLLSEKFPTVWEIIAPMISIGAVGAGVYRGIQKILQNLPSKWQWANNKLTLKLSSRIVSWLFGKTTVMYNAEIPEVDAAKEEFRKQAEKYLKRGGVWNEFQKAMNK